MIRNFNLRSIFSFMLVLVLLTAVIHAQSHTSPPSNLKSRVEGSNVKLTWEAPPDAGNVSYNIYRAETSGMSSAMDPTKLQFAAISNSTETSFEDKISSTDPNVEYIYYVVSVGSDGTESAGSNYVNVKIGQSETGSSQGSY